MKKFIKQIIKYLGLITVLYLTIVIIWGTFFQNTADIINIHYKTANYGHQFSRMKEAKFTKDVDILFLGSSHTYRGFDTRIFEENGYKTFNLGSSSQSHIQTELLLKRYLKNLNPKLVIYEVYPGLFSSDGIESSINLIGNDVNDFETIKTALKLNHIKVLNTLIYGLFADLINKNKGLEEAAKKDLDTYIQGGYVERELRFFKNIDHPPAKWAIKKEQWRAFNRVLKLLQKNKINYKLVQAPITKSFYNAYTNNAFFDSLMQSKGAYLNFNKTSVLDDSIHFFDEHHLNQWGVGGFNRELIKVLEE